MSNSESPSTTTDGTRTPLVIGWEEWLSLPALDLPAIKAKVDTGAKTSALHAFLIEPFSDGGRSMVRFGIHPIPGRDDIEVFCTSPLVDRREVTSSNGDKENRYVISSPVHIGGRTWDIDMTLTNREGMAYRMLLGRQAIRDGMLVDPAASFLQPRLSHRLYERRPATRSAELAVAAKPSPASGACGLRIAILTRQINSSSNRRLVEAGRLRGHVVEVIDLAQLSLSFVAGAPLVSSADRPSIGPFDAVVPRFVGGNGSFGAAVVRALDVSDTPARGLGLNAADALDVLRNPLALAQALARAGARQVQGAVTEASWQEHLKAAAKSTPEHSVLTVGGRAIAAITVHDNATADLARADASADFALAERIVRTLALGLAVVDFGSDDDGRIVVRVSGSPRIGLFERVTGVRVADAILQELETRARLSATEGDDD